MAFYASSSVDRVAAAVMGNTSLVGHAGATGALTGVQMEYANKCLQIHLPDQASGLTAQWQGSTDNVHWANIGSAQTASGAIGDTVPYKYVRLNVTALTNATKSTTIAQTGGTATATSTAHGFDAGDYVVIAGADQAGYNGTVLVLTAATNSFTYAVAAGTVSPATGTITSKAAVTALVGV